MFATRLTRLTRALASRNPERAIQRAAAAAPDWSSGTRIGDALKTFNDRHGRRGMARGAVVVILSDGWERGDPTLVGPRDGAPCAARLPDRVGQPARQRHGVLAARRRDGGGAAALRCARQRPQPRGARRGVEAIGSDLDRDAAREARLGPPRPRRPEPEEEPWASATPVPGQLGGDAERLRPEPGPHDAGMGARGAMSDVRRQEVHLPGLRAPRGAAAPARRPATQLLRSRGAQRPHRTPGATAPRAAGACRKQRPGGSVMADEAYRAVFLRVHPTGKMVLSLTIESDGKEVAVRAAGRRRARRPGARRQGRARRREPLRHRPRLQHQPFAAGQRRRSAARPARSAQRRSCSRASTSDRRPIS